VVVHAGSGIVGAGSDLQVYQGHRNLVWTYVKDMPGWALWAYLPAHLAANVLALAQWTARGKGRAVWRAKRDALAGLPRVMRQRRSVQGSRTATTREVLAAMERGWPKGHPRLERRRTQQT
jgi:hypothetical protein